MASASILGPAMLCGLSAVAAVIVCIAALVVSATALAIASFTITCSLLLYSVVFCIFAYVCLSENFTTDAM